VRTLRLPKGIRRTINSINIVIRVVPKRKRNSSIDCGAAADRLRLLTATMAKKSYSGESMEKDLKIHMARALVHIVHVMCASGTFPCATGAKHNFSLKITKTVLALVSSIVTVTVTILRSSSYIGNSSTLPLP